MTEADIIAGCQRNEAAAQEYLYHTYSSKMLGVCYRYSGNRADAEDMLQEGFIRVFSQIRQFRGEGSLEGWIRKVMVHTSINILKKNKRLYEWADLSHAMHLHSRGDWIPSLVQARQIVELIRSLPLGYRTVLNLYAIEGYSHREIGQLLDIEESTSRSQYARAKLHLQGLLIREGLWEQPAKRNKHRAATPL